MAPHKDACYGLLDLGHVTGHAFAACAVRLVMRMLFNRTHMGPVRRGGPVAAIGTGIAFEPLPGGFANNLSREVRGSAERIPTLVPTFVSCMFRPNSNLVSY
jgi:hypothetical protein